MKIALIGNMNNNFFSITRYLRDLGCDAHLYYENNLVNQILFNLVIKLIIFIK